MKVLFLLYVFFSIILDNYEINSINIKFRTSKIDDDKQCLQECLKISKSNRCFCDKNCNLYDDCCELFSIKCKNFFSQTINLLTDKNVNVNSCCSHNTNSECFCDSKCVSFNDCCEDYQRCDKISIGMKNSQGKTLANRFSNGEIDNNNENIIDDDSIYGSKITIHVNLSDK